MNFQVFMPTRVLFGSGCLNDLHTQKIPGEKALVVISKGQSVRKLGYLDRLCEQLQLAGLETAIFDQVEANPLSNTVMAGAHFARGKKCDLIIALGGGSSIDAAKAIAVMATNPGECWDYVHAGSGKGMPIVHKPLPVVVVTTTAGTGSELNQWGVITNEVKREKLEFGGIDDLFPVLTLVDPELMLTIPARYTAFQGFDALFHSIEGYLSRWPNPVSDMYACSAVGKISVALPRAAHNGQDIAVREEMALGSILSGMALCVGSLTSLHSLAHVLSAYHQDLPHGAGLIMLSNAYFAHLIEMGVAEKRFVHLAQLMGLKEAHNPAEFIAALNQLQNKCGVADLQMSNYGVNPTEFPVMVRKARETMGGLFQCDQIAIGADECVAIMRASFS